MECFFNSELLILNALRCGGSVSDLKRLKASSSNSLIGPLVTSFALSCSIHSLVSITVWQFSKNSRISFNPINLGLDNKTNANKSFARIRLILCFLASVFTAELGSSARSEERRVGKSVDLGGRGI